MSDQAEDSVAGDSRPGDRLVELVGVMARLRAECPWKAGQTHRSLARYLLEETHETLEAIDAGDATGDWEHLREELGDLLLQVYFHAVIAEQAGEFDIDDVAAGITEKLVRRNPHVFAPEDAGAPRDAESVNEMWEAIKATEKQRASVVEGLPPTLPALLYADKVLDRLSREAPVLPSRRKLSAGPEAAGPPSRRKLSAEPGRDGGVSPEVEVGDRLLAVVAEARTRGVDPEQALRDAVRRLLAG
jgi:XTP/dITP diphosphohydrolase